MIITVFMTSCKMKTGYCAIFLSAFCILACGTSCIYVNEELGSNFIPIEQRYTTHIDEFPLENIALKPVDQLSGYSSTRVTIGAIMTESGEVSERSSAFSLIPAAKYDFGEGGTVAKFHFAIAKDTLSYIHENQKRILQDVNVYALNESIEDGDGYISTVFNPSELVSIADGAIYDGGDSLSFDFRKEWANEFLHEKLQKIEESAYDSVGAFTEKVFPGIYIDVEKPSSAGGRINMFTITTGADLQQYYLSGGYATMTVQGAKFDGKEVEDTTFMFLYGARDFSITQEATDYYSGETLTPQYALNMSSSTLDGLATDHATDEIIVDGGGGLKPVISAREIREKFMEILAGKGIDPKSVIINKATMVLPYDLSASYEELESYPAVLSPTCKVYTEGDDEEIISYAGITDTSVSSENQGDINRSKFEYAPDISYHMQQILALDEYSDDAEVKKEYEQKDIWLLTLAVEQEKEEQEGTSEYYENLQYSMYYNSLYNNYYGYGYGGYGYGYGGYYGGYGYNNYYDYYAIAAYYSALQSSQSQQDNSTTVLDRDRYYKATLCGPEAEERAPYLKVTYSVRQK